MDSSFIKKIIETSTNKSDKIAVVDENGIHQITYKDFLNLSLKACAFIKQQNIEKGSCVCIYMKKGSSFLACELGCWLAGYIAVPISDTTPIERVNVITKHCGAALVITEKCLSDIAMMNPATPHLPDSTDDALIIYTSGSTGTPKGVLHTFATLDVMVATPFIPGIDVESVVYASAAPFSFALSIRLWDVIAGGGTCHVLDDSISKSPAMLEDYIYDYSITVCNISPAVQKFFHNKSPKLQIVFGGGEKYTTQYSKDGYIIWSDYGQSETIMSIAQYQLPDHPIDKVPVGKCNPRFSYRIIDENGNDVPKGETGELILKGTFFKEYYKAPELTAQAIIDGWLHTKDLVYENTLGELQFVNRNDWMIKINGQRVEPGEIENAMRNIPEIRDAIVKAFSREDGSVYICAYYISDSDILPNVIRENLKSKLNSYMIPSFFVRLNEFPMLPNGKIDRKSLAEPTSNIHRSSFKAPENEMQKCICDAMKSVLHLENISIDEDFFELGGNSILCMQLSSLITEKYNAYCPVSLIYNNTTPQLLAEAIINNKTVEIDPVAETLKDQHLLPYQRFYLDYQLYSPDVRDANNVMFLKMPRAEIDPYCLKDAFNKAVRHYANMGSVFTFDDNHNLVFRYRPDLVEDVQVTETTEDMVESVYKPQFSEVFGVIDCIMYKAHIYCTSENSYLFLDTHHAIFDGAAQRIFLKAIFDIYNGLEPGEDRYFEYLSRRHRTETENADELQKKMRNMQSKIMDYDTYPNPDLISRENEYGLYTISSKFSSREISEAVKKKKITINCAVTAAGLLCISNFNNSSKAAVEWIYNGRDELWKNDLVGLAIDAMPVFIDFDKIQSTDNLLEEVTTQMNLEVKNADYSLAVRYISPCHTEFMKIVYDFGLGLPENAPEGSEMKMDFERLEGSGAIMQCIVFPSENDEPFSITLTFNKALYSSERVEQIARCMITSLEKCLGLAD